MSRKWSKVDAATGQVLVSGACSYEQDIPEPAAGQYILYEQIDGSDGYLNPHGEHTKRPTLDIPATSSIEIGEELTVTVPEGTAIKRLGETIGITDGTPLKITGQEVGVIEYELQPPFPYKATTLRITVGEDELKQRNKAAKDARMATLGKHLTGGVRKVGDGR